MEIEDKNLYKIEKIYCMNNGKRIFGLAYIPKSMHKVPLMIYAHELGYDHTAGIAYAECLVKHQIAVYTFDFCGGSAKANKSDGTSLEMSALTETEDLKAVFKHATKWSFVDPEKIMLMGASQGGLVSAIMAGTFPKMIQCLILLYPAFDIDWLGYKSLENVPDTISLYKGWMEVGKNYVSDLWNYDIHYMIKNYHGAVLILHGDQDTTVPISYSIEASKQYKNSSLRVIEGGEHVFHDQPFEKAVVEIIKFLKDMNIIN